MSDPKPLVVFLFTYLPKLPATKVEFAKNPQIRKQWALTSRFAADHSRPVLKRFAAYRIGRSKGFWDTEIFRQACAHAAENGADLLLGDIAALLIAIRPELYEAAYSAMMAASVPVVDASTGQTWQEMTAEEHAVIIRLCGVISTGRRSRRARSPEAQPVPAANREKATARASQIAKVFAESMRQHVERFQMGTSNRAISPSALAQFLNKEGLPSARGNRWSHNAAANLLRRLGHLDPK